MMMTRMLLITAICIGFISLAQTQNRSCTPQGSLGSPGFDPANINFKNFDQVTIQGQTVTVDYIDFRSIENLPCGLDWSTNKSNSPNPDRFQENEVGCIEISGATDDSVGQYRLKFNVTAKVEKLSVEIDTVVRALGIRYDLQVKADQGDNCPVLDTNKAGQTACDGPPDGSIATGIADEPTLAHFAIAPNPFTGSTTMSVHSRSAGTYNLQVHNLLGKQLRNKSIKLSPGQNNITFKQKKLSTGFYIVQLTDGQHSLTRKLVIGSG
ncbi:MAG: hypothetical protein BRD50_06015 [Bacteroidetes bacterium SW_11_45_7]|nr:MAG: hypothetical protein BRD50_06015 [Bacteroidetes bacterium SW_11_45_7]